MLCVTPTAPLDTERVLTISQSLFITKVAWNIPKISGRSPSAWQIIFNSLCLFNRANMPKQLRNAVVVNVMFQWVKWDIRLLKVFQDIELSCKTLWRHVTDRGQWCKQRTRWENFPGWLWLCAPQGRIKSWITECCRPRIQQWHLSLIKSLWHSIAALACCSQMHLPNNKLLESRKSSKWLCVSVWVWDCWMAVSVLASACPHCMSAHRPIELLTLAGHNTATDNEL